MTQDWKRRRKRGQTSKSQMLCCLKRVIYTLCLTDYPQDASGNIRESPAYGASHELPELTQDCSADRASHRISTLPLRRMEMQVLLPTTL